jgi:peptidoglycan/LPS O-acetylase OafA/YrhL
VHAPARSATSFQDLLGARHLPALDGLRAVAVGGVLLFHFGLVRFAFAIAGVSLFFVISGFLITHLLLEERERTGTISLRLFYARRALRIFPAYYVFLAVAFAVMAAMGDPPSRRVILSAVFYVSNYVQAAGFDTSTLVSHAWSLAVEEQFYLLWPLVLVLVLRRGRDPIPVLSVAIIAIIAWRCMRFVTGHQGWIYYAFDTRADFLLTGCALAVAARRGAISRLAVVVAAKPWYPLIILLLCAACFRFPPYRGFIPTVGYSVVALLLAIFLVQCMMLSTHPAWRWLEHPVVRYIGRISYPLYLYHQLAPVLVRPLEARARHAVVLVAEVVVSVALAMLSWYLIERPFLRLKDRLAVVDVIPRSRDLSSPPTT